MKIVCGIITTFVPTAINNYGSILMMLHVCMTSVLPSGVKSTIECLDLMECSS